MKKGLQDYFAEATYRARYAVRKCAHRTKQSVAQVLATAKSKTQASAPNAPPKPVARPSSRPPGTVYTSFFGLMKAERFYPHAWALWVNGADSPTEFALRSGEMLTQAARFRIGGGLGDFCRVQTTEAIAAARHLEQQWHAIRKDHERAREMQTLRERMDRILGECERQATTQTSSWQSGGRSWKEYPFWRL